MAENQYINKVIYDGNTLIDLTSDTIEASDVLNSKYFHLPSGERVQGTSTFDADTSDATAVASELLATKTAYVNGVKVTGTMPNNAAVTGTITTVSQEYTVPQGYHDGSGKVAIDAAEQAKLIASNILQGVTVLGVTGSLQPASDIQIESSKNVTPTSASQTILPSTGYDVMAEVVVAAVPYVETDNAQGGKTVTIL